MLNEVKAMNVVASMERNSFDEVKSQVQKNARELEALKEEVGKLKATMKEQKT